MNLQFWAELQIQSMPGRGDSQASVTSQHRAVYMTKGRGRQLLSCPGAKIEDGLRQQTPTNGLQVNPKQANQTVCWCDMSALNSPPRLWTDAKKRDRQKVINYNTIRYGAKRKHRNKVETVTVLILFSVLSSRYKKLLSLAEGLLEPSSSSLLRLRLVPILIEFRGHPPSLLGLRRCEGDPFCLFLFVSLSLFNWQRSVHCVNYSQKHRKGPAKDAESQHQVFSAGLLYHLKRRKGGRGRTRRRGRG